MNCLCLNVYYCHRVTTQLQLTNISYHIILKEKRRLRVFEKTTERGAILSVLLTGYYSDDQSKKEMVGSCRRCGGREEVRSEFWWGNLRERGHWKVQAYVGG